MPASKRAEIIEHNKKIEELELKARELQGDEGMRARADRAPKDLGAPQRPPPTRA